MAKKKAGPRPAALDQKVVRKLLRTLETNAPPRDREAFVARAKERAKLRYAKA